MNSTLTGNLKSPSESEHLDYTNMSRVVDREVQSLLEELIDQIQLINSLCDHVSTQLALRRHDNRGKKTIKPSTTSRRKKKTKIFSSSEDDTSSSDESFLSEDTR